MLRMSRNQLTFDAELNSVDWLITDLYAGSWCFVNELLSTDGIELCCEFGEFYLGLGDCHFRCSLLQSCRFWSADWRQAFVLSIDGYLGSDQLIISVVWPF